MGTCFVIQPFDGAAFDKRYDDTLVPAIEAAGLEPYRVDRDPRASIPIEHIEEGIRRADVCLADISMLNPNVWFELGYAIAARKEVVLIAVEDPARRWPFDIQHRAIIRYRTESLRDFDELGKQITARLRASLEKVEQMATVAELGSIATVEGLTPAEMAALVATAQNTDSPKDHVSAYQVRDDMTRSGHTKIAATLALRGLIARGMITFEDESDRDGESYVVYSVTDAGMAWLERNQHRLVLRETPAPQPVNPDDIPF
jgi:nucleoside 2-deoxyribosyltransferase